MLGGRKHRADHRKARQDSAGGSSHVRRGWLGPVPGPRTGRPGRRVWTLASPDVRRWPQGKVEGNGAKQACRGALVWAETAVAPGTPRAPYLRLLIERQIIRSAACSAPGLLPIWRRPLLADERTSRDIGWLRTLVK